MSISQEVARGAAWSFASRYGSQAALFATTVYIARHVAPESYGLVSMVTAVTAFGTVFTELGLGTALVQRSTLSRAQIDAAFLWIACAGFVAAGVVFVSAPAISRFYARPQLTLITRVCSFGLLVSALAVVPRALLTRRMQLGRVASADLLSTAFACVVSVALAFRGANVWAVVAGPLVSAATGSLLLFAFCDWRPRLHISPRAARPLVSVSAHLLAFSAINYWARTADNVLIGKYLGERELGLYSRAYSLMLLPISQISAALGSAMLPAMSRLQHHRGEAKSLYLEVGGLTAFVALPLMFGMAAVAPPFIHTLYGPQWVEAAPLLAVLAPVGALQSMMSPSGWIFISQGRTDRMFYWGTISSTATLLSFAAGIRTGSALGVAVCYALANLALFAPCLLYSGRLINITAADLAATFAAPFGAAAFMAGLVAFAGRFLPPDIAPGIRLAILVTVGVMVYFAVAFATRMRHLATITSLARRAVAKGRTIATHEVRPSASCRPQDIPPRVL